MRGAEQWPDDVALVYHGERTTYRQLEAQVDRVARNLVAIGVAKGDNVGFYITNSAEFVIAIFAALRIGAVAVPFNTRYRETDLTGVIERADCKLLIAISRSGPMDFVPILRSVAEKIPSLEIVLIGDGNVPGAVPWSALTNPATGCDDAALAARRASVRPEDLALIVLTSGTTGHPKGVMHDHSCLRNIGDRADLWSLAPGETTVNYMPMFHLYSFSEIVIASLLKGVRQIVLDAFDAHEVLDLTEKERVNVLHGFDTHWGDLLKAQAERARDVSSLRFGTFPSGMPSSIPIAREVQKTFCPTVTGTGQSESWGWVCTCPPDAPEEARVRMSGRPLPGVEMRVAELDTNHEVPVGTLGELLLRGYTIMKGYYRDPEATARAIDADGWLHTGDQAVMEPEGYVRFTGRYKEMLKVGGENVSAQGVELELMTLEPAIKAAAVVGLPDARLAEVPVAYVVADAAAKLTEESVIAACRGKIASFKIPRRVVFVESLPMTASGKVQRYLLKERAQKELI